jgi:hypothetical protein
MEARIKDLKVTDAGKMARPLVALLCRPFSKGLQQDRNKISRF